MDVRPVAIYKEGIFREAFHSASRIKANSDYDSFCKENADWLLDYALFKALKREFGGVPWHK